MKLGAAGGQPAAWLRTVIRGRPVRVLAVTGVGAALIGAGVTSAILARPSARAQPAALRTPQIDLGQVWGRAFAQRAAQHESLTRAEADANQVPAGATVDRAANMIRFHTGNATMTVVANPPNGRDMAFRIAGLENPTIRIPRRARVTIRFVNGDSDSAHGWLLLDPVVQVGSTVHGPRAFPGADAPILGDPTPAGQPMETITFRATTDGTYRYECPVPGHAAMGMQGTLDVTG